MGEWVSIYRTGDDVRTSLFVSILEEQGIPCIVRNQNVQNLFGVGTMGAGFNPIVGPIELMVEEEFAETAVGILRDVEQEAEKSDPVKPEGVPPDDDRPMQRVARFLAWSWLLGTLLSIAGGIAGLIFVVAVGLGLIIVSLFGYMFKIRLHWLGYEWPTLMDANWMLLRLGWRKAHQIPPAADVETLPEMGAGDPDSLVTFMKRMEQHRRMAKKARKTPSQRSPSH